MGKENANKYGSAGSKIKKYNKEAIIHKN